MTFPDEVFAALRTEPGRVVIEHDGRKVTNTELLAMTRRIAAGLRALGVRQGVAVAMDKAATPEAVAAYLACFALGATVSDEGISAKLDELLASEEEPLLITTKPNDVACYDAGEPRTYEAMSSNPPKLMRSLLDGEIAVLLGE